jgi:hypothetical protein
LTACQPVIKNKELNITTKNWDKTKDLDPERVAFPCGAMARSVFNGKGLD